jgi:hypothetical protein
MFEEFVVRTHTEAAVAGSSYLCLRVSAVRQSANKNSQRVTRQAMQSNKNLCHPCCARNVRFKNEKKCLPMHNVSVIYNGYMFRLHCAAVIRPNA